MFYVLVFSFVAFIGEVDSDKLDLSQGALKIREFSDKTTTVKRNYWLKNSAQTWMNCF